MKITINVSGIENKGKKMNILDGTTKYNFWITKQDGNQTKAMEGFSKLRPIIGDTLTVEFESKDASFTNDQGKTINYKDNQILYFYTDLENHQNNQSVSSPPPVVHRSSPAIPVVQTTDIQSQIDSLKNDVSALMDAVFPDRNSVPGKEISIDDIPF